MKQNHYPIEKQIPITDDIYRLYFKAEDICREARSGQFVHIRIGSGIDPLLRRPFSIHRIQRKQKCVEILYRVVGRGTEIMSYMGNGHSLDVMGPLGKGFAIDHKSRDAVIVAGGMGIAPVFFLIDELLALNKSITLFWGVRSGNEIIDHSDLIKKGIRVLISTEDGSAGAKGMITGLLHEKMADIVSRKSLQGFVCGPHEMLNAVQKIALETDFNWQASLEENMACGIGVCQGCAVSNIKNTKNMVCCDGPVFNLKEISFHG
jgi:dihydroorotate dehydrogenase electron transfer subunit